MFHFFQGLHVLVKLISGRYGHKIRYELGKKLNIDITKSKQTEFELFRTKERLTLLLSAAWLLEDWPIRFIQLCHSINLTRSRLMTSAKTIPFWILDVADTYLDCRIHLPNTDEILVAGAYLLSCKKEVTPSSLRKTLPLSRESGKNAWHTWNSIYIKNTEP